MGVELMGLTQESAPEGTRFKTKTYGWVYADQYLEEIKAEQAKEKRAAEIKVAEEQAAAEQERKDAEEKKDEQARIKAEQDDGQNVENKWYDENGANIDLNYFDNVKMRSKLDKDEEKNPKEIKQTSYFQSIGSSVAKSVDDMAGTVGDNVKYYTPPSVKSMGRSAISMGQDAMKKMGRWWNS